MKKNCICIVSFALIILWVYTAVSKLAAYNSFTVQMRAQPLPVWSVPVILIALPVAEITAAALLPWESTRQTGLLLSFLMLTAFAIYVALALSGAYGSIPCACGGIFTFMQWKGHLVFNGVAAVVTGWAWYNGRRKIKYNINQ